MTIARIMAAIIETRPLNRTVSSMAMNGRVMSSAVPGAHDVLARIHAAAQLVTPPLGLERVGDESRPEEVSREADIELVTDARAPIGMDGPGAREVLRIREHLVARHGLLARAATH